MGDSATCSTTVNILKPNGTRPKTATEHAENAGHRRNPDRNHARNGRRGESGAVGVILQKLRRPPPSSTCQSIPQRRRRIGNEPCLMGTRLSRIIGHWGSGKLRFDASNLRRSWYIIVVLNGDH